jgi:hypothetical protein
MGTDRQRLGRRSRMGLGDGVQAVLVARFGEFFRLFYFMTCLTQ